MTSRRIDWENGFFFIILVYEQKFAHENNWERIVFKNWILRIVFENVAKQTLNIYDWPVFLIFLDRSKKA